MALTCRAGGTLIGKTVSTEFATMTPGPTVNPSNPAHTPGGSSSGSAAAVADFSCPLAFGTQTAGSVIRPAAFCGVVGYKPTYGTIHRAGMKVISESLDTIGAIARSVADCALLVRAVTRLDLGDPESRLDHAPRLAVTIGPDAATARPETVKLIERAARAAAHAGATVRALSLPVEADTAFARHPTVMFSEAAEALAWEMDHAGDELSPALREKLTAARALPPDALPEARASFVDARRAFVDIFVAHDAIITASAPGEAPHGLAFTGDPAFNQLWTALHGPCVTVPVGEGPNGLPLGVQIVAAPGRDAQALAIAAWLQDAMT